MADNKENVIIEEYKGTVASSDYIIHALGGMDGDFYINSIDCLEKAYDAGYRLFEVDVSFTSDDVLVLAHSGENNVWSKNDWEKRLGQKYPFDEDILESDANYDSERHLCDYETFMQFKIQGKYKASDFCELLNFMEKHTDMYVMVDAGHRSYKDTQKYYKSIVEAADGRTGILDHIIAGGQTTYMVKAAREAYDFPLINLYFDKDEKREEEIYTPEDFIKYCEENEIISFSVAKEVYNEEVAGKLKDSNLISYVFTVNDENEADRFRGMGADVIGTDFLW